MICLFWKFFILELLLFGVVFFGVLLVLVKGLNWYGLMFLVLERLMFGILFFSVFIILNLFEWMICCVFDNREESDVW